MFTDAVNNIPFAMVADGTLAEISEKWVESDITTVKEYLPAE